MERLQRWVSYINRYEENEKKENLGFAKCEIRGSEFRMELHLRGVLTEELCEMYLYYEKDNKKKRFPFGTFYANHGAVNIRLSCKEEKLETYKISFEQLDGIIIYQKEDIIALSQWKEETISIADFKQDDKQEENTIWQEEQKEEEKQEDGQSQNEPEEKVHNKKNLEILSTESDSAQTKYEYYEKMKDPWERIFQKLRMKNEIIFPLEENVECIKMDLKDLKDFPQQYWYVGKNSFLLHSYFAFQYFIMGKFEEEGAYFLGIPGVFQSQECVMASMFGFPDFHPGRSEQENLQRFGFWCREL